MKRLPRFLSMLLVGMVLAGCATISVQRDYDEQASFDGYQTFSWTASENTQDIPTPFQNDGLLDKRIKRAVTNALVHQGYTEQPDGAPDFYVVYRVGLRDVSYDPGYSYGFGYRSGFRRSFFGYGGFGYPYGGYGYGSHGTVTTSTEGTLVIDIIDAGTNELVWRGAAVSTLGDATYDVKDINKAVEKILEEFPPLSHPSQPQQRHRDAVEVLTLEALEGNRNLPASEPREHRNHPHLA